MSCSMLYLTFGNLDEKNLLVSMDAGMAFDSTNKRGSQTSVTRVPLGRNLFALLTVVRVLIFPTD